MSGKRAVTIDGDIVLRPYEKRRIALALLQSAIPGEDDANYLWTLRTHSSWLRHKIDDAEPENEAINGIEGDDANEDYNESEDSDNFSEDDTE